MTNARGYAGANSIPPRLSGTTIPADGGRHDDNLWVDPAWFHANCVDPVAGGVMWILVDWFPDGIWATPPTVR
jgi:hypothetical protein